MLIRLEAILSLLFCGDMFFFGFFMDTIELFEVCFFYFLTIAEVYDQSSSHYAPTNHSQGLRFRLTAHGKKVNFFLLVTSRNKLE